MNFACHMQQHAPFECVCTFRYLGPAGTQHFVYWFISSSSPYNIEIMFAPGSTKLQLEPGAGFEGVEGGSHNCQDYVCAS